ncbi:MAG: hypothetical protein V1736_09430 [Pseudomonadota bacterium]
MDFAPKINRGERTYSPLVEFPPPRMTGVLEPNPFRTDRVIIKPEAIENSGRIEI